MELTRFKIFLWDQFILPVRLLFNMYQLQAALLALLIVDLFLIKSFWILVFCCVFLLIIYTLEVIKYYKSGEFMYNWRKYKSDKGEYKDYKIAIKKMKEDEFKNFPEDDIRGACKGVK